MYDDLGELSNHVQEVAGAIRAIKVFGSQPHEQQRFDDRLRGFYRAGRKRALLQSALESGVQILMWACLIAIVVYGFYLSSQGAATYGQLVTFMLLAFRVAQPLGTLTGLYASAQSAAAAAAASTTSSARRPRRLRWRPLVPRRRAPGAPPLPRPGPRACPHEQRLLRRWRRLPAPVPSSWSRTSASATATAQKLRPRSAASPSNWPPASVWPWSGPSGAGKSTLACLLLRLFDPQQGRLLLDGKPYPEHDLHALRRRLAYVPQEAVLYDASIADNIRFGLTTATDEQVRQAAARAHALGFIERLPDGFATTTGDRGIRLSGGERQRLILARAFLRNPDLLVLDEPTSALDAASEEAVQRALAELMAGRTTVIVAHRLSLVRDLDRILVLDGGRMVEYGSHTQLLARRGLYAHLYGLQQGTAGIGKTS
jgi:ATP-binding cassette, subfamily B, bacterial